MNKSLFILILAFSIMNEVYTLRFQSNIKNKIYKPKYRIDPLQDSLVSENIISLFVENALDTFDDVSIHFGRSFVSLFGLGPDILSKNSTDNRKVILVAGSGWGSHSLLKVIDTNIFKVICVSPRPFFLFTPMLCSTSLGKIEYRSIIEPIRISNPFVQYIEGEVIDIDIVQQVVTVNSRLLSEEYRKTTIPIHSINENENFNITYDHLVFAVGAKTGDFGIPGVNEHCLFVKEIEDARNIKNKVLDLFELASLPTTKESDLKKLLTFVIVGGGPTGIEFAGELLDFVSDDVSSLYKSLRSFVTVKVINAGKAILTSFDEDLQQEAIASIRQRGIEVELNAKVDRVDSGSLTYKVSGESETRHIDFGLCVWAAGTAARPITKRLSTLLGDEQTQSVMRCGRLRVDPYQRLTGTGTGLGTGGHCLSAVGDCAVGGEDPLPQTAQVAAQQGAYLARLLNRKYLMHESPPSGPRGKAKPFKFFNVGSLAYIGGAKAIAQIRGGSEESTIKINTSGRQAYWLWRSVYVVKQVSTRTRVLVLFDIVKTFLFGRDLTSI